MDWVRSILSSTARESRPVEPTLNLPGHFPEQPTQATTLQPNILSTAGKHANRFLIRPATFLVYILVSILIRLIKLIYFFDRPNDRSSLAGTTVSNALMNDPISRAEHFVRELEDNLLPLQQFSLYHSDTNLEHLPPFFQGSYTQALYMASTRGKFLYVYLTNNISEGSRSLFANVVTNPKFTSIFKQNQQTLIWGGDVTDPEAYQLANSLNITKFPMIGLLCLTRITNMTPDGPRKSAPRISLVLKIQGGLKESQDPESLIYNKFIKRMVKYEPDLALIRAELREKYFTEEMRRRQDADFHRSLLRDQQKKEEKVRKKLTEKYLKWRQPYFKQLLASKEVRGSLRIAIKFEDGKRVTVLFPQTSPVEDVFVFAELLNRNWLDDSYESTMSEADARETFRNFKMKFDFKLTSTIPPRPALNDIDLDTRIEDVGFIHPSGLLMVEALAN